MYDRYFGTGSKIEKLLIEDTARILMEFPYISTVSVTLDFNETKYDVNVGREALNSLTGLRIEDLSVNDGTWQNKFVNVYTAGVNNEQRKKLLKYFLITE
ncbi:hypothetical protein CJ195_16505 [Bacillus sp. UMB0899]|nr:hypothetical protein CJ195_16505 [Bacillus sp. UMB0899]